MYLPPMFVYFNDLNTIGGTGLSIRFSDRRRSRSHLLGRLRAGPHRTHVAQRHDPVRHPGNGFTPRAPNPGHRPANAYRRPGSGAGGAGPAAFSQSGP